MSERREMEPEGRRTRSRDRWRRRAEQANEAYGLVLFLFLVTYVLASLVSRGGWGTLLLIASTVATAIVALVSSHSRATSVRRGLVVAAVAILAALASAVFGGPAWLSIASLLAVSLLAVGMGAVLQRVAVSETVTARTLLGAISVYASLGLIFSWIYRAIDRLEGGGFFGEEVTVRAGDFIFFSYTTLTTTGFGNLVPDGQVGQMLTGLEMMVGQVFLVTLVAGLVSLWRPGGGLLNGRSRSSRGEAETSG
ncbi:MAG TPA: potassium channel family protein [Solirubrobacterales bacterium]